MDRNLLLLAISLTGLGAVPASIAYFVRPNEGTLSAMGFGWLAWFAGSTAVTYWAHGMGG
jgi:hypothetical protein